MPTFFVKGGNMEEWKVISRFPDYEVSNEGRIRRKSTKTLRRSYINASGYPTIKLIVDGKRISQNVHRLEAIAFLPNENNYPCINHKDGVKTNNSISNLEWCSYAYNNQHAYDHKLKEFYDYKIHPSEYCKIVEMYLYKTKVSEIAQMYNVTQGAIYRILTAVKRKDKYEQIRQRYSINKAI